MPRRCLVAGRAGSWLVPAILAAAVAAQGDTLRLPAYRGQPDSERVEVEVAPVLVTHGRPGPAGWITCHLHNPDGRAHRLDLRFVTWSERVQVGDRFALTAGERAIRHYPIYRAEQLPSLSAHCDDGEEARTKVLGGVTAQVSVLLVTSRADAAGELQTAISRSGVVLEDEPGRGARRPSRTGAKRPVAVGVVEVRPDDLPQAWTCFAGFDAVVVDGRASVPAGSQQALLDLVMAGGVVLVPWQGGLGAGPLQAACAAGDSALGLGCLLATPSSSATLLATVAGQPGARPFLAAALRRVSGPAPDVLFAPLAIPGLGEAPVLAFFVLLTLFVVLAGPVNWVLCRRAGRPLLFALTLPLLGFGFAGTILTWGILAEGLGVRGAVHSLTWLDQRQHVAVNQAASSLFAGLTPASLTPAVGTLTASLAVQDQWNSTPHRYLLDRSAGDVLAGTLLPGRFETHLVTTTCARARQRLRFRRLADGTLEALVGPGLVPAAPGVVVCDHAGNLWSGSPMGDRTLLRPCATADVRAFLAAAADRLRPPPPPRRHRFSQPGPAIEPDAVGELRLPEAVRPGSYVAWVADNGTFDQLGLKVTWDHARHLVLGLLAEEDFVD